MEQQLLKLHKEALDQHREAHLFAMSLWDLWEKSSETADLDEYKHARDNASFLDGRAKGIEEAIRIVLEVNES